MTPAFVAAVADMLLPGDSGGSEGYPPLPPASATGIDISKLAQAHSAVFEAIAKQSGDADAFVAAAELARIAAIQAIEHAMPDAFRALLSTLLASYYEFERVLTAMGWRTDPPQPRGHVMQAQNAQMDELLSRVRNSGKRWRGDRPET